MAQKATNSPWGIVIDAQGNLFVADTYNNKIRKIDRKGNVTTIAGDGSIGYKDGPGAQAQFKSPEGLVLDGQGNLIAADTGGNRIRKVKLQ